MKKILLLFPIFLLLLACGKNNDVKCDNAQLTICNTTETDMVVFGWDSDQMEDTLFPGECTVKDFGEVDISYDMFGNETNRQTTVHRFITKSGTYLYEMENCVKWIFAPSGYVDITHCLNGVFDADQGEYDVDCGGVCPPCKNIKVPCESTLKEDEIDWNNGADDDLTYSFHYVDDSKMRIKFSFYFGQELIIKIPVQQLPKTNRKFIIGSNFSNAEMVYYNRFEYLTPQAGEFLYFVSTGEGIGKFEFCDLKFTGALTTKIGTGSLSFEE